MKEVVYFDKPIPGHTGQIQMVQILDGEILAQYRKALIDATNGRCLDCEEPASVPRPV